MFAFAWGEQGFLALCLTCAACGPGRLILATTDVLESIGLDPTQTQILSLAAAADVDEGGLKLPYSLLHRSVPSHCVPHEGGGARPA